jgi:hypothetical protein
METNLMPFDSEANANVRGMTILCEMGDLEISWEPHNDEKVRLIIEKKMREGVRFFILKPVIGDVLHMRKKLNKISDLKAHNIKIKDEDIQSLFSSGDAAFFRNPQGQEDQIAIASVKGPDGKLDHVASSQLAVKNRTVGVRPLGGG